MVSTQAPSRVGRWIRNGLVLGGLAVAGGLIGVRACNRATETAPAGSAQPGLNTTAIRLSQDELTAIMAMRRDRGNACSLHQLTAAELPAFWANAARFIFETKFNNTLRHENEAIGTAWAALAPNQKEAAIAELASVLSGLRHPYDLLDAQTYTGACARGLFYSPEAYPNLLLSTVTPRLLSEIIAEVSRAVPAAACSSSPAQTAAPTPPRPTPTPAPAPTVSAPPPAPTVPAPEPPTTRTRPETTRTAPSLPDCGGFSPAMQPAMRAAGRCQ